MIYGVFSIRDKATCFMSPIVDVSEKSAIRNFARAVNNPDGLMEFAPGDFDLYQIGTYDDQTGKLEALSPVVMIASGSNMVGVRDA